MLLINVFGKLKKTIPPKTIEYSIHKKCIRCCSGKLIKIHLNEYLKICYTQLLFPDNGYSRLHLMVVVCAVPLGTRHIINSKRVHSSPKPFFVDAFEFLI